LDDQSGWLWDKLKEDSRDAVDRLCEAGCEREVLLEHLAWIALCFGPLVIKQRRGPDLQIGPKDSWPRRLREMDLEDLEAIKRRAEALISDVNRLRPASLVALLRNLGLFHENGLLGSPVPIAESVLGDLLILPDLAREFGPRKRRGYHRVLENAYRYIKTNTRRWHDAEMVPILFDITPNEPTVDYLKKWRSDHRLTRAER
jgi:hypothetical protein